MVTLLPGRNGAAFNSLALSRTKLPVPIFEEPENLKKKLTIATSVLLNEFLSFFRGIFVIDF